MLARSRFRFGFRLATPIHSLALASRRMIRHCSMRFACVLSALLLQRTSFLPRLTFVSPPSFRSFQSHACGFFSAFAHATCSLSVCSQYLGLGFNAPVFALHIQARVTLSAVQLQRISPTRLSLSMAVLSRTFGSCSGCKHCTTSPPCCQGGIQVALCGFQSLYLPHRICFLFLRVLRYFSSPRMLALLLAHN